MRADEAILRLASAAWQVEEFLTELAKEAIDSARLAGANAQITRMSRTGTGCDPTSGASFDCAVLAGLRDVVLGYALRLALEHSGVPLREVGAKRIEDLQAIVRAGAGAIDLPAGFRARCEGGMFVIVRQERHADAAAQSRPAGAAKPCDGAMADLAPARDVPLGCPGVASLPGGARISCRRQPITPEEFAEHCRVHPQGREWLDAEQVRGPLLCRPVRADDAFWPLGASCRRSVREFLKKQHRTAGNRQETFCICDELGVIFVAPLRIDSRVRVTPGTREVMVLETCQPSIP